MKPEFKVEGDVLKITAKEEVQVDSDGDGQAAIKGSLSLDLELDGSEVIDELVKSNEMVAKIKEKLGL